MTHKQSQVIASDQNPTTEFSLSVSTACHTALVAHPQSRQQPHGPEVCVESSGLTLRLQVGTPGQSDLKHAEKCVREISYVPVYAESCQFPEHSC